MQGAPILDQIFWDELWKSRSTGWDIGHASPPIAAYMAQYPNKNANILIPGCGNAHEAKYLAENGFANITLLDIAPTAVELLQNTFAGMPQVKVVCGDFFQHQGHYDLLIEQTFFCAISPSHRRAYAQKAASMLNAGGKIIGVLFDKIFEAQGPPFGGYAFEYQSVFQPYFSIKKMERCYNSIPQRANVEVFIVFVKKSKIM